MSKVFCRGVACIATLLLAFGTFAHADESDEQAIGALYESWRAAVQGSSIAGYLDVLHEDVRLLPPGSDAVQGRAQYGEFLKPVFASATYKIEVHRYPQIEVRGDTAIAEYDYTIHLTLLDDAVGTATI